MKTKMYQKGFTLVELLVVITIIAILASVSVPVFSTIQRKGKLSKSLQQARQIGIALRSWAGDSNGLYPQGETANKALAQVVPDLEKEDVFYVAGCLWHGTGTKAQGPDGLWETSKPQTGTALEAGENHYAYAKGFNDSTSGRFPLLASGFTTGQPGTYTDDPSQPGGVWAGKNAVVIFCDGSGNTVKLNDEFQYIDSNDQDVFRMQGLEMLNPEQG